MTIGTIAHQVPSWSVAAAKNVHQDVLHVQMATVIQLAMTIVETATAHTTIVLLVKIKII